MKYDDLTQPQKAALFQYMVIDGGVEIEDYEEHVRAFSYRIEVVKPKRLIPIMERWDCNWYKEMSPASEEQRIRKIKRFQNKTGSVWPYITSNCQSVGGWEKDEMCHGDGWHRLTLALRENRPIEFMFLKTLRRLTKRPVLA